MKYHILFIFKKQKKQKKILFKKIFVSFLSKIYAYYIYL